METVSDRYVSLVDEAAEIQERIDQIEKEAKPLRQRLQEIEEELMRSKRDRITGTSGLSFLKVHQKSIKVDERDRKSVWDMIPPRARVVFFSPTKGKLEALKKAGVISQELYDHIVERFGRESVVKRWLRERTH